MQSSSMNTYSQDNVNSYFVHSCLINGFAANITLLEDRSVVTFEGCIYSLDVTYKKTAFDIELHLKSATMIEVKMEGKTS